MSPIVKEGLCAVNGLWRCLLVLTNEAIYEKDFFESAPGRRVLFLDKIKGVRLGLSSIEILGTSEEGANLYRVYFVGCVGTWPEAFSAVGLRCENTAAFAKSEFAGYLCSYPFVLILCPALLGLAPGFVLAVCNGRIVQYNSMFANCSVVLLLCGLLWPVFGFVIVHLVFGVRSKL